MRAARTLRMIPPYHTRPSARRGAASEQEGGGEEEEEEEEGEGENQENRPPGVRMRLDPSMADLVDGLLNPVDVPEFLARPAARVTANSGWRRNLTIEQNHTLPHSRDALVKIWGLNLDKRISERRNSTIEQNHPLPHSRDALVKIEDPKILTRCR